MATTSHPAPHTGMVFSTYYSPCGIGTMWLNFLSTVWHTMVPVTWLNQWKLAHGVVTSIATLST
eukprot:6877504-Ditylum_brightwellii.AAC.1